MIIAAFVSIFVLGLIFGSFINALEYRIGTKLSIAKGRSICPKCKKQLAWYDNVPLVSFLLLRGRCRQCKKPISWQYPLVELLTGVAFAAVATKLILTNSVISTVVERSRDFSTLLEMTRGVVGFSCLLLVASCLVLIALHDAKTSYIVSPAVYIGVISMAVYFMLDYVGDVSFTALWQHFSPLLIATAIPALLFAALHYFSRGRWMGAGDIELAVLIGLFAGWPGIIAAYYFAFIAGSIWGLALVYLAKKAGMKSEMPFGPFLVAGAFFGFLFGQQIIDIYAKMFLGV